MANTLAELLIKVTGDTSQANRAITDTTNKTKALGTGAVKAESDVKKLFKQIQTAVTIGAVAQLGRQITQTGIAFNEGLANVDSLLAGTSGNIEDLKDDVKDLAISTGTDLASLTDGLYQVVSAFGATNESVLQLEQATIAAKAGVATVTDSINLATAVTKAYGDTSAEAQQKVFDAAFATVKLGVTSFPELASSIQQVTDRAVALGISQEELFASFATLTGVTGDAAKVSTQLRAAFVALDNPTSELSALYQRLGIESGKALVEQEGLQGALAIVNNESISSGVSINKLLGSVEAVTAASTLGGAQAENYAIRLEEVANASGATAAAFDAQVNGINQAGASIDKLTASIEVLQTQLFDLYSEDLQNVTEQFTFFVSVIGGAADAIKGAKDALGPLGEALDLLNPARFVQGYNRLFGRVVEGFRESSREAEAQAESAQEGVDALYEQQLTLNRYNAEANYRAQLESQNAEELAAQADEMQAIIDLENERVQSVIQSRLSVTDAYEAELSAIKRKSDLGLLTEQESIDARLAAEEEFQNNLIEIGYDGVANAQGVLDAGDQQLLDSIERREEMLSLSRETTLEDAELTAEELLGIEEARIAEEDRLAEAAAERDKARRQQQVQAAMAAASQILSAFTAIAAIQAAQGDAELQRLQAQYDAAEDGSELQEDLAEQLDKKKRTLARDEAIRQKGLATFGAVVGTAGAIINALNTPPFPVGLALSILAATTGALQIAAIQSQPIPALATGGIVPGVPSTTDNTMVQARSGEEFITEEDPRHSFNIGGNNGQLVIKFEPEIFADIVINDFVNTGQYTIDARGLR